ncbi:hypothetical protein Bca52824_085883 [Brassica carinata]|uniref:At2g35280-like TPR domain-containing protein n=1 Tax=Brassica carinata TaxID=52824 RepID=A0A8X7TLA9_BRACI|nr:hypothetical protein Bca52824_085883 [Brassica carinata]
MGSTNSETNYNSDESTGSCEGNPSNTDPNTYFKNLDLQLFVEEPLAMLCSFRTFRNECLSTGNPKAHYIEGLLQYFQHRRSIRGLKHLRQSADANYDYEAISVKGKNTSIGYPGKLIKLELFNA